MDKKETIYNKVMMLVAMMLPLCLCFAVPTETMAKKPKKLVILHTNDTHSTIMPVSEQLPDTMKAGRGGFVRRVAMIKEERKRNPDLLYFDSGDFSQGSAYYTMFKGDVEIGLMNLMGLDAATIGNHEFDFGLENMARLFRMANFPIVCANYDFTGTCVEGLVKPYVVIKRNGMKIGVFGLAPEMKGLVSDKNCVGVKFLDPVAKAQEMADILKNEKKCDLVVCISHLGWGTSGVNDQVMMSKTRNIDIVLGGHSHTFFNTLRYVKNLDGVSVPNDQNGKSGIFVGRLLVDMKKK